MNEFRSGSTNTAANNKAITRFGDKEKLDFSHHIEVIGKTLAAQFNEYRLPIIIIHGAAGSGKSNLANALKTNGKGCVLIDCRSPAAQELCSASTFTTHDTLIIDEPDCAPELFGEELEVIDTLAKAGGVTVFLTKDPSQLEYRFPDAAVLKLTPDGLSINKQFNFRHESQRGFISSIENLLRRT